MSTFARFAPRLQEAIAARLDWTSLRPVQELAGEVILNGENAVVLAPTAGGKTEASIFPALSLLLERPVETVGVLYIAPIKALLNNQSERLDLYTEMVGLRRFVWHGDTTTGDKRRFLREPSELLMTTPESLEVMLVSPRVAAGELFRDLRIVIVDEVHALAGTDRGAHFMSVLQRLSQLAGQDVQRIGLSATIGNPDYILRWLTGKSKRKGSVIDPPKVPARRRVAVYTQPSIGEIARVAARQAAGKKSLFFCQSRSFTESVADRMRASGTEVFVHHSSVSQGDRAEAERNFHEGSNACIACTSTLELGIDVGDLDLVFQANAPSSVSSFLQRMGRTGRRAGTVANTIFLVEDIEIALQAIALVELAKEGWVEAVAEQTRCWPVLVHQLLVLTLERGAVSKEDAWDLLSCVPDFSGIGRPEYDDLIDHMLAEEYLYETGGALAMGDQAERVYGRKNFMELYAVFSSPVLYSVVTEQRQEIGSLEQNFVDSLVEDITAFLLGGRAWFVDHINHSDRLVRVRPAPYGKKPSWGGFIPQMLSFDLCQRIRRILEGDDSYPYIQPSLAEAIEERRGELGESLRRSPIVIHMDEGTVHCWTFAGGRINQTLRYIFTLLSNYKVVADNFQLRMEGNHIRIEDVRDIIKRMHDPQFWVDKSFWSQVMRSLPEYRLSKFQRALPDNFAQETVGRYLLDIAGTRRLIGSGPEQKRTNCTAGVGVDATG